MKRHFSLLMAVLGLAPILAQQNDYCYYYKGNRIDLTVDSTRLYVVSEGELNLTNTTSVRTAEFHISHSTKSQIYNIVESMYKQRSAMPMSEVFLSTVSISEGLNKSQYDMLVKNVKETNGVWQVLPSFFIKEKSVNVTNNFYVKLKSAEDYSKLQQMASQYNIEIVGYNKFMPLWYTLSCTASSTLNAIEAANLFHRSSLFACSEPEFSYSFSAVDSNDELYELQWNLLNTGQDGGTQGIDINYCCPIKLVSFHRYVLGYRSVDSRVPFFISKPLYPNNNSCSMNLCSVLASISSQSFSGKLNRL